MARLVADLSHRGDGERGLRLAQVHAEYAGFIAGLENNIRNIAALERPIVTEMSDALVL